MKADTRKRGRTASIVGGEENFADPGFSATVIRWQKAHGRHALPWQQTRDAYRIWLSEIMLQQTQVAAVIPYYERFLQRFPDVATLAAAQAEEVMSYWSGLGYYSRARNLHQCAKRIVGEHAGIFPSDPQQLAELPGIGRSTAAAIAAFAYGVRAAILDGNVKRVFARVFGIDRYPGERQTEEALWRRAVALLPEEHIEAYTQGLMDLGATVCVRSRPHCTRCPLSDRCMARATGRTAELPVRKPATAKPEKSVIMLVITNGNQVLLERRPDSGIWGGLLSLPELPTVPVLSIEEGAADREAAVSTAQKFGAVDIIEPLAPFSHAFTHFRLHVRAYRLHLNSLVHRRDSPSSAMLWKPVSELDSAPLPAPVKKLLTALFQRGDLLTGSC